MMALRCALDVDGVGGTSGVLGGGTDSDEVVSEGMAVVSS